MKTLKKILLFLGAGILFLVSVILFLILHQFIYYKTSVPLWNAELEQLIPKYKIDIQSASHCNRGGYHAEFHIFIANVEAKKEFVRNINRIEDEYIFYREVTNGYTHYKFYKNGYRVSIEDRGNGAFRVNLDDFTQAQFDYIYMNRYSK